MHHSSFKPFLSLIIAVFVVICASAPSITDAQQTIPISIQEKIAALEASANGRIGIYAINTANNTRFQYRAYERFPLCSTSKVMVVAAILKQSMSHSHYLQQTVTYNQADLVAHSPVTEKHLMDGMTISDLCAAAITQSDNTANNLLVKKLGGAAAVTAFARSIGDTTFRLDRLESALNTAIPGDVRDTSTPAAMVMSLQRLVLGDALAAPQRELLLAWLKNNTTGNLRIRAGVPKGWIVGDKTGSGEYGTTNDIAIIWPPKSPPIIMAIYFTQKNKDADSREDVISSATRLVLGALKN